MVKKPRRLPIPGEVFVKEGDKVSQETVVAKTHIPGNPHIINIASTLNLNPMEIERYMLKKVGDSIKENEQLALYDSFFGLFKKTCLSPVAGTLEHLSATTGQAIIRMPPIPVEVKAYIPGVVVKVLPNEGAVVQTSAALIQGIFGIGGEANGDLMLLSKDPEDMLRPEQISPECSGKILVGGSLVEGDALQRALETGVKGIIVGGIKDKDLVDFCGYELGVAITGHEETRLTLIITEGFGKIKMSNRTFDLLKKFHGKQTCINGATQIRAGVMRPEIIIPYTDTSSAQLNELTEETTFQSEQLKPGTLIRLIREPYFGYLGKIVSMPIELQYIETESKVRVLKTELQDGREVIVPRANVEIIEE